MDDGEIALTEFKLNPYFPEIYRVDPARVAERVDRLRILIDQGYVLATIEEAVAALRSRGVAPETLPAIIDGTWQPKDTNNVYRWMGGSGLFFGDERDSEVLSTIWSVARRVRAAARLGLRHPSAQRGLTAAWRELLLAQVSDATGWNPFWGEVQYGFDHAAAATALLADVEGCERTKIELPLWSCGNPASVDASVTGVSVTSPGRSVDLAAQRCDFTRGHRPYEVLITTLAFDDDELGAGAASLQVAERTIEITVAIDPNSLGWVPALTARSMPVDLAAYSFDTIGVALPVGLMQIGPDRWLVVDQSSWRLAVLVEPPNSDRVRFVDESVPRSVDVVRRLVVLDGANEIEALAVAELLNGPGLFD